MVERFCSVPDEMLEDPELFYPMLNKPFALHQGSKAKIEYGRENIFWTN